MMLDLEKLFLNFYGPVNFSQGPIICRKYLDLDNIKL
jgi:hypothetical protein